MDVVVIVVATVCLAGMYITWTAARLDRMTQRVAAAWGALDAQLVRRAAVVAELAAHARRRRLLADAEGRRLERAAIAAQQADAPDRESAENDLSLAIADTLATGRLRGPKTDHLVEVLDKATTRVGFARQFFNDAVRDNRALRRRWLCRLLTLRRGPGRGYFEIADVTEGAQPAPARGPVS